MHFRHVIPAAPPARTRTAAPAQPTENDVLDAMSRMREAADQPLLAIARQKNAVGYFTHYFPWELLLAAGLAPVRLLGFAGPTDRADAHLQAYACSLVRSSLAAALSGALKLTGAAFAHSCDTIQRLHGVWTENRVTDWTLVVNFPTDISTDEGRDFLLASLRKARARLHELGHPIADEALADAIELSNRARFLYAELRRRVLALKSPYLFSDLLAVSAAGHALHPAEWSALLDEVLESPLHGAELGRPTGIYLYGGDFTSRGIAKVIEDADARVVGEELSNSARDWPGVIDTLCPDPLEALARFYYDRVPDATKYRAGLDRAARLVEEVRACQADAVLFPLVKFCEPNAFDYPHLKRALDAAGIPSYLLEHDIAETGTGQYATRLQAFLETLE